MLRLLQWLVIGWVLLPVDAQSPIEPTRAVYGADGEWFCAAVEKWQAIMAREHPDANRSVPEIERRCHFPRTGAPA